MRYELTDGEWVAIKPMLPNKPRGVPRVNDRRVLNGIFWVLRSGAPWRDLPDDFGPYTTCYNRFVRWRRAGVWGRIMDALASAHDASVQMIDTSIVRVHQHGACIIRNRRQSMGRSRGGLTSKIHVVVDTNGLPVRLALTAGEAHDNRLAGKLLSRLKSGSMLLADRGYDADWIRALAARKGALANIPPRCNRTEPICFSPYLYRARNLVERFFNRIKHCRRIATRYDKLAANYLAFIQLASIRLWLRVNESASLGRVLINAKLKAYFGTRGEYLLRRCGRGANYQSRSTWTRLASLTPSSPSIFWTVFATTLRGWPASSCFVS
jgi:transposase